MPNGKDHPELSKLIAKLEPFLLPCPFCGGKAEIDNTHTPSYWVECTDCGAQLSDQVSHSEYDSILAHGQSINNAFNAWNTRTKIGETLREAHG